MRVRGERKSSTCLGVDWGEPVERILACENGQSERGAKYAKGLPDARQNNEGTADPGWGDFENIDGRLYLQRTYTHAGKELAHKLRSEHHLAVDRCDSPRQATRAQRIQRRQRWRQCTTPQGSQLYGPTWSRC